MALFGVLCRLVFLSSLALDTRSLITLEFTTPRSAAPDSVSIVFPSAFTLNPETVSVAAFQQAAGHDWRDLLAPQQQWKNSAFFSKSGPLEALEIGSSRSLLSSDPYFDGSFTVAK